MNRRPSAINAVWHAVWPRRLPLEELEVLQGQIGMFELRQCAGADGFTQYVVDRLLGGVMLSKRGQLPLELLQKQFTFERKGVWLESLQQLNEGVDLLECGHTPGSGSGCAQLSER